MSNKLVKNVIFIYGFLVFLLYWINMVFNYLFEIMEKINYRFFVVDFLGFGDSLKFRDC